MVVMARSLAIAVLLLVGTLAPAVRCLIPSEYLNAEERACCKKMAGECGSMPASHECCKNVISAPQPALSSSKIATQAPAVAIVRPEIESSETCFHTSALTVAGLLDPSPPPNTFTILRI